MKDLRQKIKGFVILVKYHDRSIILPQTEVRFIWFKYSQEVDTGPAEQFLKCEGHTRLFNWGEGLILKMVKRTVTNLDFFPRGRPAVADHFNPLKLLFIFGIVFY